ncbi:hypothetical protein [Sulfitobacter geojensis]|uniref:hypothetical protein n=1 Tax=Sulfitobacter geojensis TaxID=1342299 RepID=UPI0036D86768
MSTSLGFCTVIFNIQPLLSQLLSDSGALLLPAVQLAAESDLIKARAVLHRATERITDMSASLCATLQQRSALTTLALATGDTKR